jgi:two-component sensor histidine kinase
VIQYKAICHFKILLCLFGLIWTNALFGQKNEGCYPVDYVLQNKDYWQLAEPDSLVEWLEGCYPNLDESATTDQIFEIFTAEAAARINMAQYDKAAIALNLLINEYANKNVFSIDQKARLFSLRAQLHGLLNIWDLAEQDVQTVNELLPKIESPETKVLVLVELGDLLRRSGEIFWRTDGHYEEYELLHQARSIAYEHRIEDKLISKIHNRIAAIFEYYQFDEDYPYHRIDSMEWHSRKAYYYANKANDPFLKAMALNQLGAVSNFNPAQDSAEYYFHSASLLWQQYGYHRYLALGLINQIDIKFRHDQENIHLYKSLIDSCYQLVKDQPWSYEQRRAFDFLSYYYEIRHNFEEAFRWKRKQFFWLDSLNGQQQNQRTEVVRTTYETAKKQQKIEKQQFELNESNEARSRLQFFITCLSILLACILILVVWMRLLNRKVKTQAAQISDANKALSGSLQEKEILLKEINHRVKNNLQMIIQLLEVQESEVDHEETSVHLNATKNRLFTMAMLHQAMFSEHHQQNKKIDEYIKELCHACIATMADVEAYELNIDCDSVELELDTIICVGMIINELITNTLKYATIQGKKLSINLNLKYNQGEITLRFSDNGPGIPEEIITSGGHTGMYVINAMARQIKGELQWSNNDGLICEIVFRKHE